MPVFGRVFGLDVILSVTTGVLVAKDRMDAIYDIMGYMTHSEDIIFTIGLLTVADSCERALVEQYPFLGEIETPEFDTGAPDILESVDAWMQTMYAKYGKEFYVKVIDGVEYHPADDIKYFAKLKGLDN